MPEFSQSDPNNKDKTRRRSLRQSDDPFGDADINGETGGGPVDHAHSQPDDLGPEEYESGLQFEIPDYARDGRVKREATPEEIELARFLQSVELFREFDMQDCLRMASFAKVIRLDKKQRLFKEGDPGSELYCVRSGEIAITRKVEESTDSIIVRFGPGSVFGEMALIENRPRSAGAKAMDATELVSFDQDTLDTMLNADLELLNKVLWALLRVFCVRLRETNEQLRAALRWGLQNSSTGTGESN